MHRICGSQHGQGSRHQRVCIVSQAPTSANHRIALSARRFRISVCDLNRWLHRQIRVCEGQRVVSRGLCGSVRWHERAACEKFDSQPGRANQIQTRVVDRQLEDDNSCVQVYKRLPGCLDVTTPIRVCQPNQAAQEGRTSVRTSRRSSRASQSVLFTGRYTECPLPGYTSDTMPL